MQQPMCKVYLVDDDSDDLELLSEAFADGNHAAEIACFTTSATLLHQLNLLAVKDLPDLIIMDHQMPLLDGSDLVNVLREEVKFSAVTIAVYSSWLQETKVQRLLQNGVDCYIEKGGSMEEIREHANLFYSAMIKKQSAAVKEPIMNIQG